VCWNLRASTTKTIPVSESELGYVMVSGFSKELLKMVMTGDLNTVTVVTNILHPYKMPEIVDKLKFDETLIVNSIEHVAKGLKRIELKKHHVTMKQ
jgi:hypothetical protein